MKHRILQVQFVAALLATIVLTTTADGQQGIRHFQCAGNVSGVASQALLEITPGGLYTEGPGVAGRIRNQYADYGFTGTLFGGTEGFISLVELRTGVRIDRVWIGLTPVGFNLRTEDGAVYVFHCRS